MISRGRLRRAAPPGLDWHRRLAASRRRAVRARRAGWSALAAAVLVVAVGASGLVPGWTPWWAGASAALAAGIAAALPVADAEAWARRWIAARHGLGYDTSLEADGRDDPYRLWQRARERTALELRDARPPAPDRWWLPPAVAVALVLAATPLVGSGPDLAGGEGAGASGSARPAGGGSGPEAPLDAGAVEAQAPRDGGGATAPPERPVDAGDDAAAPAPDAREDGDDAARPGGSEGSDGDGGSDDAASQAPGSPVERFLRDLETTDESLADPFEPVERPDDAPNERGAGSPAQLGERRPTPSGDGDAGDRSERRDGDATGDEEQPGDGDGDQGQAQGSGATERDDAAREGPSGQGPDDERSAGEEGGAAGAAGERGGEPGSEGDESLVAGGEAEEQGLAEGDPAGGGSGSGSEPGERAGPAAGSEGAGVSAGDEGAAEPSIGGAEGPARRLPGELEDGEAPVVGSVRGGGAAPEALPEGRQATPSEARGAERAAEEQGLPGAYREIIRRYFR
jgi:hypothetical protein